MEDIDAQRVRDYLDHLSAEGKAKKTALNARSVISCVFSYWCNYMHGTGNPVRTAALPKKMPVNRAKGADQRTTGADRGTPRRLWLLGGTI